MNEPPTQKIFGIYRFVDVSELFTHDEFRPPSEPLIGDARGNPSCADLTMKRPCFHTPEGVKTVLRGGTPERYLIERLPRTSSRTGEPDGRSSRGAADHEIDRAIFPCDRELATLLECAGAPSLRPNRDSTNSLTSLAMHGHLSTLSLPGLETSARLDTPPSGTDAFEMHAILVRCQAPRRGGMRPAASKRKRPRLEL